MDIQANHKNATLNQTAQYHPASKTPIPPKEDEYNLASNPQTSQYALYTIARIESLPTETLARIIQHANTTVSVLTPLSHQKNLSDEMLATLKSKLIEAVKNSQTSAGDLAEMTQNKYADKDICELILHHPNKGIYCFYHMIKNPNTSKKLLMNAISSLIKKMVEDGEKFLLEGGDGADASDPYRLMAEGVAANEHTDKEIINLMLDIPDMHSIDLIIAHKSADADIFAKARGHEFYNHSVKEVIKNHINVDNATLQQLNNTEKMDDALNKKVDKSILFKLLDDVNLELTTLHLVIKNPNADSAVLAKALDGDKLKESTINLIVQQDHADQIILIKALNRNKLDGYTLNKIIQNPNSDKSILVEVANRDNLEKNTLHCMLNHKKFNEVVLDKLLEKHSSALIDNALELFIANPNTHEAMVEKVMPFMNQTIDFMLLTMYMKDDVINNKNSYNNIFMKLLDAYPNEYNIVQFIAALEPLIDELRNKIKTILVDGNHSFNPDQKGLIISAVLERMSATTQLSEKMEWLRL